MADVPNPQRAVVAEPGVYERLGLRPVVNGMGAVTMLGGSLMPPEVVDAMREAAQSFVVLEDLQRAAGERIAALLGVPAAMVTSGAASGIAVCAAACLTGGDPTALAALPDTGGRPRRVVMMRTHRTGYEAQLLAPGAEITWVDDREDLPAAMTGAAMALFLGKAEPKGITGRAFADVARRHAVPVVVDAASDIPPLFRIRRYLGDGFDLVILSGGKALRGPQASGIVLGDPALVAAAQRAISPHGGVGRAMKVGKEEIVGLVAAVERYVALDHDAEQRRCDDAVAEMSAIVSAGADARFRVARHIPLIANEVPHLAVEWDEDATGLRSAALVESLRRGDPPVWILDEGPGRVVVSVWMMQPGDHLIAAQRLSAALTGAV